MNKYNHGNPLDVAQNTIDSLRAENKKLRNSNKSLSENVNSFRDEAEFLRVEKGEFITLTVALRARADAAEAEAKRLREAAQQALDVFTGPHYGGSPGTSDAIVALRAALATGKDGEK